MLKRLRLGMAADQLRAVQMIASDRDKALIQQLLRRCRWSVRNGRTGMGASAALSATVSLALRRLAISAGGQSRRQAVLATVALWCNVEPADGPTPAPVGQPR